MNMQTSVQVQPATIKTPTPEDLQITPRDRRFGRDAGHGENRWWLDGDPIATAFYNALSLTFPRGEAFFVESVKAFRDVAPEKLQKEIRAFVKQEITHTREHVALNRRVEKDGYDVKFIDDHVREALELTKGRPAIANLAVTMILEHFTAMLAHQFIANPRHFANADKGIADLWRWHSLEEIEHKGVAYDTWLYATRDWSRWKRWKVKSLLMLVITRNFWTNRYIDTLDLLAQDGLTGWRTKAKLLNFMLFAPGVVGRIIVPWIKFFLPGFHPWNEDDRHLIDLAESEFTAALPKALQPA